MSDSVTMILSRALQLIALEEPRAHTEIALRLDGLLLNLEFEDSLCLEAREGVLYQSTGARLSDVRVLGNRGTVIDLIRGRITFAQAVCSGRIEISGAIGKLTCALSAVEYFVSALLRIDASEELIKALEAES